MKTKEEIVKNWLPKYTGNPPDNSGQYILLTNFHPYPEKIIFNGRSVKPLRFS